MSFDFKSLYKKIFYLFLRKNFTVILVPNIDGNDKALSEAIKVYQEKVGIKSEAVVVLKDNNSGLKVKKLWL